MKYEKEEKNEILKIEKKEKYIHFRERNVPIRIDGVFKIVMGNPENRKYLKEFLEAILHRKINGIIVAEPEKILGKDYEKTKDMKVDLLVQFENDEIIDVEIQNENQENIFERSLAYASGILYNSYRKRDEYSRGNKTIIWITDFNISNESKEYHEIYSYKNKDSSDEKHYIEHHFIQLPKFIEQLEEIRTEEEKWLAYFSGQLSEKELRGLYKMGKSIKEINEIVEAVMTDPEVDAALNARVYRNMERYFDRKDGYTAGEREGIEKRREEKTNRNS